MLVRGTSDNDVIRNTGEYAGLDGGAGNDSINSHGKHSILNGGNGNDVFRFGIAASIQANGDAGDDLFEAAADLPIAAGQSITLDGGAGNDTINIDLKNSLLLGGDGKDVITCLNYADSATIQNYGALGVVLNGGGGSDLIVNNVRMSGVTICGDPNNDVISLAGGVDGIQYSAEDGDGFDTVYGFNSQTKLDFEYGTLNRQGNDVIMSFEEGAITFKDVSLDLFNVNANNQLEAILEPKPLDEIGELDQKPAFAMSKFDKVLASVNRKHGR